MSKRKLFAACFAAPLALGWVAAGCGNSENLPNAPMKPAVDIEVPEPTTTAPTTMVPSTEPAMMPAGPRTLWKPTVGMTWDWQLSTPVDYTYNVQVYDIDLFETEPSIIEKLHQDGKKVVCYVNLGAWEDWRPDKDMYPKEVIGAVWPQFPHENWLDIRRWDLLAGPIRGRLDMAVMKGCDAVEPDNMDGYNGNAHNESGFPLTFEDQLKFNRQIVAEAHARKLAVGLKNDVLQAAALATDFDFHVSEQCFEYDECKYLMDFIRLGKPIFEAEYNWPLPMFCAQAKSLHISAIRKSPKGVDAWRENCPP
jgi:hypothetical protein